jgi:O-antigen/teichoic acid export membrane protein
LIRVLRLIEQKIFGADTSTMVQGGYVKEIAVVFCIQGFALISSLAISLIITNLLGAEAYGTYSYGFSWINLLAVFSCLGYVQRALKADTI